MKNRILFFLLILAIACNNKHTLNTNKEDMKNQFKPQNYNTVSPYLIANEPDRLLNFIVNVFNAKQLSRYNNSDGSILHVELLIDDSVVMLSGANDNFPATKSLIHVFVPDAKQTFRLAIENGAISIQEPVIEEGDSDMRGMFQDFEGNIWAVATHNM